MSDLIKFDPTNHVTSNGVIRPLPELPGMTVRDATTGSASDLAFIDSLQKMHSKAVGWMPTGQLEGHIAKGHVIVAEDTTSGESIGYCIGVDRYFKREDVGIIYQMNIAPGRQRGLVGATLLKAMFDRWPYGVRLCCCWCAQDLAANRFWEAMGFVPLAFRSGSRRNGPGRTTRVHIFWQKRIRVGDVETPWWYPSQTGSGAIKEDRLVLPIPPGVHWSETKPQVLPGVAGLFDEVAAQRDAAEREAVKQIEGPKPSKQERAQKAAERKARQQAQTARAASVAAGGLRFGGIASSAEAGAENSEKKRAREAAREQVAKKNDPRLVAMARELRDRWLEQVAAQPGMLEGASGGTSGGGKYEVGRLVAGMPGGEVRRTVTAQQQARRGAVDQVIPQARRLAAA